MGEIADALDIRQPRVSKHLRVLDDSGIVTGESAARRRIYRLQPAPFEQIGKSLTPEGNSENARLTYDARSWTEGEEEGSTIHHTNDITLTEQDGTTTVRMHITITKIGPKAKMAAFGMKWGYKAQLTTLEQYLSTSSVS